MKALLAVSALYVLAAHAPVLAQDLDFLLINDSSADLVAFNVSTAASTSWEMNLMRGGYLAPGYEIDVVIADGEATCIYDIRGLFSDGASVEDYGLDLCEMGEYIFTD
ncbi:hypothetical protein [Aestuariivita sp.]|uniref:hypothetical protein n=1 Tax=Aestuariivita sp. TaxID=1872407 RepID=UPI00216E3C8A|nr:hypothetical protein [Aestuariivita sp.]MCE8009595.1 hypothetical protein [Aestuariivita sp.]